MPGSMYMIVGEKVCGGSFRTTGQANYCTRNVAIEEPKKVFTGGKSLFNHA